MLPIAALMACAEPHTVEITSPQTPNTAVISPEGIPARPPQVHHQIVDTPHGGTAGFYFLAPISTKPQPFNAPLDPTLLPRLTIKICALPDCTSDLATFTNATTPAIEFTKGNGYSLKWDTRKTPLSTSINYRLRVYVTGDSEPALLGFADIDVIPSAKDAKTVSPDMVALVKDAKLDVKFRVETGFVSGAAPAARADSFAVDLSEALSGNVTADNGSGADVLGAPEAVVTSFGGGSAGGSVTDNAAGSWAVIGSGNVQIAADGSISFGCLPGAGVYTVHYRISNAFGSSDATVTITVGAPDARDDTFGPGGGFYLSFFADTGNGADNLGSPAAKVVSYGGGSVGGTVDTFLPGKPAEIPGGYMVIYDNGMIAVVVCSRVPGTYTVNYKIANSVGSDVATITFVIEPRL